MKEINRGQLSPKKQEEYLDYLELIQRSGSRVHSQRGHAYKDPYTGEFMVKVDQMDFRKKVV